MYLIWFHPLHHPPATKEYIVLFRKGRPIVRSGRPGLLLEAVQTSKWEELKAVAAGTEEEVNAYLESEAPSHMAFLGEWWSESPKSTWGGKTRIALSPLAVPAGPSRTTYTREPGWAFEGTPQAFGRVADRSDRYVKSVTQNVVSVLLARAQAPEIWKPALESFDLDKKWKLLRGTAPSQRYELVRDIVEGRRPSPEARPSIPRPAGMELWTVVEAAHARYHAFPKAWLKHFPRVDVSAPPFCFFARNWWEGALIEIAWAVEHNVWSQRCRHPSCDTWFLQAGRQGRRRLFCERHKGTNTGATIRYRHNLKKNFPKAFEIMELRRSLKARRRRGTISESDFQKRDAELTRKLRHYRRIGLAPSGKKPKS